MKYIFTFIITVLMGAIFLYSSTLASAGLPPDCGTSCTIFEDIYDTDTCPSTATAPSPNERQCELSQKCIITTILNGVCDWPLAYEGGIDTYKRGSCVQDSTCKTSYSGTVYVDANGDGAGDEAKSDVTIKLEDGPHFAEGVDDPQEQWYEDSSAVTGENGTYRFDDVAPRENYRLRLVITDGYSLITANPVNAAPRGGIVDFILAPPPSPPPPPIYSSYYGSYIAPTETTSYFCAANLCDQRLFDDTCAFNNYCQVSHHASCISTGNFCARYIMNNDTAICQNSNNQYAPYGEQILANYNNSCAFSSSTKYFGFQFYIPPPSTSTPTLTVNPDTMTRLENLGYSFAGFQPGETLEVWVNRRGESGIDNRTGGIVNPTAGGDGSGNSTIYGITESAGDYTLRARGTSSGRSAEANFTIVDSASTTTPTACPTLTAPIGLKCNYNKISWNPVAGADRYPVRVDSAPVSWAATTSCDVIQNPDACVDNVFTNFQDYTFTPGINYHVWVHAVNDCGASSSPAESWSAPAEITCDGSAASAPINSTTPPSSSNIGSIIDLNVGVTNNAIAWIQSVGSDIRWDSGFTNPLPQGKYASLKRSNDEMPGIIFSGALNPDFGSGKASENPFNWQVGGSTAVSREVFTDTHSLIPTSYRFLLETADGSGIAKKTAADLCSGSSDLTNCILTPALANGVYAIDGGLNLNGASYTFPAGKNFVILVNGNLNINGKIFVPVGSTAIFSASGNIIVSSAVGERVSAECDIVTHAGCSIEGLYSADISFVAEKNVCTGNQQRLNIAGSVIANAGRRGGSFVNKRTLCANNATYPSVSFVERPDFMLNYPSMVTQTTRAWQEVAP